MKLLRLLRTIFIACILAIVAWLVWPGRNMRGNPWMEELNQSCTLRGGTVVRFYVGNGGATTAFWYSVTSEEGLFMPERQIFYSYHQPALTEITCSDETLVIALESGELRVSSGQISTLRKSPLVYFRGLADPR